MLLAVAWTLYHYICYGVAATFLCLVFLDIKDIIKELCLFFWDKVTLDRLAFYYELQRLEKEAGAGGNLASREEEELMDF